MIAPRIAASNFRGLERNTLRGFVDLTFLDTSLTVKDVAFHEQSGRQWVSLPARPVLDTKTGMAERYPDTGKIKYANILNFSRRDASDAFQREALAAIARLNSAAVEAGHAARAQ
jgi:hypothetical protein